MIFLADGLYQDGRRKLFPEHAVRVPIDTVTSHTAGALSANVCHKYVPHLCEVETELAHI
jgi:hypothetical protein